MAGRARRRNRPACPGRRHPRGGTRGVHRPGTARAQYDYEVDLAGRYRLYADANGLPTALAPPGASARRHRRSSTTRCLPLANRAWSSGRQAGLGSMHTPGTWPHGDVQALAWHAQRGDDAKARQARAVAPDHVPRRPPTEGLPERGGVDRPPLVRLVRRRPRLPADRVHVPGADLVVLEPYDGHDARVDVIAAPCRDAGADRVELVLVSS